MTAEPRPPEGQDPLSGPLIPRRLPRTYLSAEFGLLFVAVPVALYFVRHTFGVIIIPTLVLLGLACFGLLWWDRGFERRRLWNRAGLLLGLRRILLTFVPGALLLGILFAVLEPQRLLGFPREAPGMWLLVICLYPLLSVYPQEVIFRTFLFHRYRGLFPHEHTRIVVSGLAFGLAHLFFANWIAPLLTVFGGLLFAHTYARSDSTLQASLEHSLWGDFIFTLGLGWYFYGGAIQ